MINGKTYLNHRLLYQIYHNVILDPADVIDHIDRDKTNNTKENLEKKTKAENCCNRNINKNNKITGLKNITKHKSKNYEYYLLQIGKGGKRVVMKYFRTDLFTEEYVIEYRNKELKRIHGKHASFG